MLKCLMLGAALFAASGVLRGGIVLAENGRSDYRIVAREGADEREQAAVADLAVYLKRITGADFTQTAAKHCIYVGNAAPSDARPLKAQERRIRSENGDIHIWGEGKSGTAFAVYDFLDKFLGCRWYTLRGREKIPANPSPRWETLDYAHVPSFRSPSLYSSGGFVPPKMLNDFARRNRISNGIKVEYLGAKSHTPFKLIPPGKKFMAQTNQTIPYAGSEKDEWFGTHPEYFSMNPAGKRVPDRQLCYSSPELRKLYDSKLEGIVKREYKGGFIGIRCDLNDNNGFDGKTLCCCPECMKLVEKYKSPAGAYWDYVLHVCRLFKEKYPQITIGTSAYLSTEHIPSNIPKMPENLFIGFAPLNKNFMKPYDHPTNRRVYDNLAEWGTICRNMGVQLYPAVYPRSTTILPLCANLRQLAQNLRVCKRLGVTRAYGQQGYIWGNVHGFNELRQYMLSRLMNDIELDENAVIEEFMRDVYGKAAPLMIAYWKELEELEAKEPVALTWFGLNYGTFTYLTGENLARWSRDFDKMEALVADDPDALRDVRDARHNLDEAILSVHSRMPKTPEFDPDLVAERARRVFKAGLEPFRAASEDLKKADATLAWWYNRRIPNGVDYFLAMAKAPKPLPAGMRKRPYPGPVFRVLPDRKLFSQNSHIVHLTKDADAAFGVALKSSRGKWPDKLIFHRTISVYNDDSSHVIYKFNDRKVYKPEKLKSHVGKYRLYFFGRTRLYPRCAALLGALDKRGWVMLGEHFDPKNPDAEYDVYLSLKLDDDGVLWIGEAVLCGTGRACPPQEKTDIAAAG